MTANSIPRKLVGKVAWAVAMSTAAYGIEALWEGQKWLLDGFGGLTRAAGRAVADPSAPRKAKMQSAQAISLPPDPPWTGDENDSWRRF